ncbi:MAG: glycoside hydrolase family 88 protein [Sandaracinaceae bacterium]|nr:glycoside hydrolase family 88 protein [Sandaracinaceae bacterium]
MRTAALLSLILVACDGATPVDAGEPAVDAGSFDAGTDGGLAARDGGVAPDPTEAFPDQCEPGVAPDEACFRMRRDPSSPEIELASAIADRWMAEHPADTLAWDWVDAILVYAFMELSRVNGDAALRDYAAAWLDAHIAAGYEIAWSDHCPPMLSATALYAERGEHRYLEIVEDVLGYYTVAPRTDAGGIGHLGRFGRVNPTQWLDSLMMVAVPIARWGELSNDPTWIAEGASQAEIFADTMQDDSGWLVHAYAYEGEQTPDTFWARGNGWVVLAMHEILRIYRVRGEAPPAGLVAAADRLSAAVVAAQDPATGLFWTVVNRPGDTYLETSATALFAYGLARGMRYGWRDASTRDVVRAAMDGVIANVRYDMDGQPIVGGISGPTTVGTYDYYANVPVEDDLPYGLGAVILALTEVSGL